MKICIFQKKNTKKCLKKINITISTQTLMHVLKKSQKYFQNFFSNCFSNFCQFSEFQWDKDDGDVGGDGDGDGQLWGLKLTETIPNIYQDLGKI